MRDLVPPRWRAAPGGPANALVLTIDAQSVSGAPHVIVADRRRRRETERLTFPLTESSGESLRDLLHKRGRDVAVVLRPPRATLLEREITLPLAAAAELDRVLAYEMDRFTPFRADEVFWAFAVLSRDARAGFLRLRLSVVPRGVLLGLPATLAQVGVEQASIEVASTDGTVRSIRLGQSPSPRARRRHLAIRAAAWGCAALGLGVVAQPFVRQSLARADVEARIAALRPNVARAEALRARIARAAGGNDTIAHEQARIGNALHVLAAVTAILPDDTFLTRLSVNDRKLTMEGQSAAAAKLIARLSNDKLFQEPAFTAPVTRTDHGADLFALRATIATAPSVPLSAPAR